MSLVLDASLALAWYFEDEATAATEAVLGRVVEAGAVVPGIWRFELGNGLLTAVRRGRISGTYRDQSLAELSSMRIETDSETNVHAWSMTLRLAERHELTLYDASYLELALRRGFPLATLDSKLRRAGETIGLTILGS